MKAKSKIRKGDEVIVIAGKSKGLRGEVLRIKYCVGGQTKVLVERANLIKKHVRPNPQIQEPGGIKEKEAYLDVSNVMLVNPTTGKGGRVGYKLLENRKKVRCFKSDGEILDVEK